MTIEHWNLLLETVRGYNTKVPLTAFIIDSPWLPRWAGISTLQYYSSEEAWFQANKKAIETFPDILFLPGFWSEFGMCTEPSAFGAKLVWDPFSLPHADRVIHELSEIDSIKLPNPKTDGLLPFVLQRLENYEKPIQEMGHHIKFAVARGPLNIASFLMGTTELMMAFMMDPGKSHKLLEIITEFSIQWIKTQKEKFPSIEGIFLLDDIVGFIGEEECKEYAVPYIQKIYDSFDSKLNFFHNDAQGLVSAPFLREMGVDLFNFSFEHSLKEMRGLAGAEVGLLGNLPPRDVLASDAPEEVYRKTKEMILDFGNNHRVAWSCGGGMPPDVSTQNIRAFKNAVDETAAILNSNLKA